MIQVSNKPLKYKVNTTNTFIFLEQPTYTTNCHKQNCGPYLPLPRILRIFLVTPLFFVFALRGSAKSWQQAKAAKLFTARSKVEENADSMYNME